MKLLGIEKVDGGVAIILPSGQRRLLATGTDKAIGAEALGRRVLAILDDPNQPETTVDTDPPPPRGKRRRKPVPNPFEVRPGETPEDMMNRAGLEALAGGWRLLQRISGTKGS